MGRDLLVKNRHFGEIHLFAHTLQLPRRTHLAIEQKLPIVTVESGRIADKAVFGGHGRIRGMVQPEVMHARLKSPNRTSGKLDGELVGIIAPEVLLVPSPPRLHRPAGIPVRDIVDYRIIAEYGYTSMIYRLEDGNKLHIRSGADPSVALIARMRRNV